MVDNVVPIREGDNTPTSRIIVAVNREDMFIRYEDYGLNFGSSEQEILTALRPMIQESKNVDIGDGRGGWLYKTHKVETSQNIYLIPNSTAG